MPHKIRPYDQEFYNQLIAEGFSPKEAALIAGAEMEGAPEEGGNVNVRQTAWHIFNEPAGPTRSGGQQEGKIQTTIEMNKFLWSQVLPPGDRGVEEWIKKREQELRRSREEKKGERLFF